MRLTAPPCSLRHSRSGSYLVMGPDLRSFPHQDLDDLNVSTAGCDQQGRGPVLQNTHTRVLRFLFMCERCVFNLCGKAQSDSL